MNDPLGTGDFINQPITQPSQSQSTSPGGLKGFLVKNLPSIAGGIGLVGGEVLDPFGGGLLTGTAASGVGEALKEKLLGQKVDPKQVAIQAAETGLLGGFGKGLSAAKTASKTLLGTAAEETGAKVAASEATPTLGQKVTNTIVNKAQQQKANLGGYAVGQKVGGAKLGTAASQKIAQTIQDEGINGLTAKEGQAQVEQKLGQLNQARSSLYDIHNAPLAPEDKSTLVQAINDNLAKAAGGSTPTVQKAAATFGKEALNQGDLKGLAKYKTSIDKNLENWNRNPASTTPGQQIAATAVRNPIRDLLQSKIPGLAEIDAKATPLYNASEALKTAAGKTAGISTSQGGIFGRVLGGETAEKIKGAAAEGAEKVGKALGGEATAPAAAKATNIATTSAPKVSEGGILQKLTGTPSIPKAIAGRTVAPVLAKPGSVTGAVAKQIIGRDLGGAVINGTQNPLSSSTPLVQTPPSGNATQETPAPASQYPEENMLYDIERDPKNASTYEALYKQMNADQQTTVQKNQSTAAQNALAAIPLYTQTLSEAGGSKSGIVGSLENLATKAHILTGAQPAAIQDLKGQQQTLAVQLVKALTGSSRVPSAESLQPYIDMLPAVTDTPKEAQDKLNTLQSKLNDLLTTSTTPTSTTDTADTTSTGQ